MNPLLKLLRTPLTELRAMDADDLAVGLGPAAPWLLRDEVLVRLAEEEPRFARLPKPYRPTLPDTAGSCCIIYAVPDEYPLLRPAFLLPLQWRQEGTHDPGLPAKLHRLADRVLRHLGLAEKSWSLHRLDPFRALDAAPFDEVLEHESGWAPLAGALHILTQGGKPCPDVWATGRWDGDGGIVAICGLKAKLALARAWRAREVFVPESQAHIPVEDLKLGSLQSGLRAPTDALRNYLAALDAPPPTDASREERTKYYLRQPARTAAALAYYHSHLLGDIVTDRRRQLDTAWPGWAPTHLVTVVSGSPELILLAARVLQVRHCLLLYTSDGKMLTEAEQAAKFLEQEQVRAERRPFAGEQNVPWGMWQHLDPFIAGVPDNQLVLDITPGSKQMTLALEQLAGHFRPDAWLIYVRHQMERGRVVPFSESLMRRRAGSDGGPFVDFSENSEAAILLATVR